MGWLTISPFKPIAGTGQNITVGASSASSAAIGASTYAIYVSTTGNCHLRVGTGTVTAVTTDMLIKATDPPLLMKVAPGEKIAVIQDGASTGTCNIVEATH
ncbi:hypothetical protein [Ralstonia sp. Ralssp135]|uniref:hypothetical protein n=1 Tax=Ralstonia sp. Ralssp135 TaxID=3243016 RepID=UPI0039AFB479